MQRRRELMTFEHGHWATATGSIATFSTPFAKPLRSLKAEFTPVQEGTGDPSPDNVRPITGWTGMTLYHASKNIFSSTIEQGSFNSSTGAEVTSSSRIRSKYVPISAGMFTVSNSSGLDTVVYVYDTNQSFLSDESIVSWQGSTYTFTVTKAKYVRFAWKNSAGSTITPSSISGIQLECGSAATTYEPYSGTTLPIDWSSAGTVYGGYVDLVTGEVWETHRKVPIVRNANDTYWNSWSSSLMYNSTTMGTANGRRKAGTEVLSDTLTPIGGTANPQGVTTLDEIRYYGVNASYPQYLFMANPDGLSAADWRKWLYDTYPDASLCYELATPTLVTTLTPTELRTLIGTNNIWSTANGNVTAEYFTR